MVDNQAVAALNLPKSTDGPQPGRTELPSCPAEGAAEGEARKFSLGVTLPTVPARLVKRILLGEFIDMGELSQEALREEFRRLPKG